MGYWKGDEDVTTHIVTAAIIAASFGNVIDLNWIMFALFKKKTSLYFWSFFASTWGVFFHQLGFLFRDFEVVTNSMIYTAFIAPGWVAMVTGQSLVLYSRLHLLVHYPTILRLVLAMITTNVVICHVPILVLVYGLNIVNDTEGWLRTYLVYEKLQITLFFLQEVIISSIYVWATSKIYPFQNLIHGEKAGRMRRHIILVNIAVIALDIMVLAMGYAGFFDVQTVTKALVYSLKLKIEVSILNSLKDLARSNNSTGKYRYSRSHRQTHVSAATEARDIELRAMGGDHQQPHGQTGYAAYAKGGITTRAQEAMEDEGILVVKTTDVLHDCGVGMNADNLKAESLGTRSLDDGVRPTPSETSQTGLTRFNY